MKKRLLCLVLIFIYILSVLAYASVIGEKIDGYTLQIAEGTSFTHLVSYSDQAGVGRQTENYVVYQPNGSVKPLVSYGKYLYGSSKTSAEAESLSEQGRYPVAGTNADFFSFKTGVPMSDLIVDGRIVSKDGTEQWGLGFLEDGSTIVSQFSLFSSMVKEDGSETILYNINKYRQPYALYLMTNEFSSETRNETDGYDIVLSVTEGDFVIGTEMTAVVEKINRTDKSEPIPEGKMILTVDANAPAEFVEPVKTLKVGEKVTFKFGVLGDERWENVKLGMGALGGMLLSDGKINPNLEKGAAPRTALGVTEDGNIILYTIDGRQLDYSYGVQLKTLASRMKELGCRDAINLDGGGSTTFIAQLPGMSASVVNSPSDGYERNVSTFFFFENLKDPTGEIAELFIYPRTAYILKGGSVNLQTKAVDGNYHSVQMDSSVNYWVEEGRNSTVSSDGVFTALDEDAFVTIYAEKDGVQTEIEFASIKSPTDIRAVDKKSGARIDKLTLKNGEIIDIDAQAFGGFNQLVCDDECFDWSISEEIGVVDGSGVITVNNVYNKKGTLEISAGDKILSIPVAVAKKEIGPVPEIEAEIKNGSVVGTLESTEKLTDFSVFADGKLIGKESDYGKFEVSLPKNTHKITIYANTDNKYTNVKYLYVSELSEFVNPFADTDKNWAKDILSYMYSKGIISGEHTGSGLIFRPQKEMTRAEFAVMCCNYLGIDFAGYEKETMPFKDKELIPQWAEKQLKALYYQGIFMGRAQDNGVVADPMGTITRAEAATIISRIIPSGLLKAEIKAVDADEIPSWAVDAMETLVGIGAISGYEDGSIRPLGKLTKAEAAKLFYSII
ncbi:MAG: phosphodiester glycosidase family protein [Clostridia bacterium]|nr:phosphodiester glycosidase family protein [Clostridia bacterium]